MKKRAQMPKPPFLDADLSLTSFQFLEDLSTAYWFSQALFSAIELGIFDCIEHAFPTTAELAGLSSCKVLELTRLLTVLERMELIMQVDGHWSNSQIITLYLTKTSSSYMGNFLLYRKYMQDGWQTLTQKVSLHKHDRNSFSPVEQDYDTKIFHYVQAMDQLLVHKAKDIVRILNPSAWQSPILDVGGGAGALGRALLRSQKESFHDTSISECSDDLLELEEVLRAARAIYTDDADWHRINTLAGDFRHYSGRKKYGLIVLSNFLHAYSQDEAEKLLQKAVSLLSPEGMILIHDYFPDRLGITPSKAPLYDLAMMLNTFNGRCHNSYEVSNWLDSAGMAQTQIRDLETDSSIIVSVMKKTEIPIFSSHNSRVLEEWPYLARQEGFKRATVLSVEQIIIGPWVRKKCQYGCDRYGKGLQCPPYGMDNDATQEMIESYSWCLLVEGMPPGRSFHEKLLSLEAKAFLAGFHKAFAFTAGHCPVCDTCPADGECRFPAKARPSMESSGIDVYGTASQAGFSLVPVQEKMQYVKYIGLLMLE
jgi:predicted metal-binding protein/2-polyprenyl-3-methyl-5-hydroxy-6-metoxy-1,4-benzoquinol methylase